MDITHRALYNSLRMNWVLNPTLEVEAWQIEDYRSMPLDEIFEKLEDKKISLSKSSFLAYADAVDTPEELTDLLTSDSLLDTPIHDQNYLLLFELWRRFLPEKPGLSLFCDELDHQIHLYDRGQVSNAESIQDVLANLEMILDQNTDQGTDPIETLKYLNSGCANDIESFLYDFISEQIDNENYSYASELLEEFSHYISDAKWFEFLRIRILAVEDIEEANILIGRLIKVISTQPDLAFNLELLSFLVGIGEKAIFHDLVKKTINLLKTEEDFQNTLSICADFYHRLDLDSKEELLQGILNKRKQLDPDQTFNRKDPLFLEFLTIIE
jgi:hypothetical protein